MKGPVAAATEAVRVVAESGRSFPGELVLVAIGLHEAPGGRGEDLTWLLAEHGFTADYAVVCELSGDRLVAAHMGQATVEIEITREGMPTHELQTRRRDAEPGPGRGARDRGGSRAERRARGDRAPLGRRRDVLLRRGPRRRLLQPPSGDVPTRRNAPVGAGEHARRRCRRSTTRSSPRSPPSPAARSMPDLKLVRDAYSIDPEHPLALALREGYEEVTGRGARVVGRQGRRRRRDLPGRRRDPDRLPRPARRGRARGRRVGGGRRARPVGADLPRDARAPVGRRLTR